MTVNQHNSGIPFWAKLLIGFVVLKMLIGTGIFTLLFWGAIIWFVFSAMGKGFGFWHCGEAHTYEKRKRDAVYPDDPGYGNGKAKREDISIV